MIGISQRDRRRRIHEALGWFEAMKAEKDFKHEARCQAARLGSPWKGSQPYSAAYLKVLKKILVHNSVRCRLHRSAHRSMGALRVLANRGLNAGYR